MKRNAFTNQGDKKYGYAFHAWSILTKLASTYGRITYGEIDEEIRNGIGQNTSYYLDPVAAYCEKNGLPSLTVLAVRADNHKPNDKFKEKWLHNGETAGDAECRVWSYDDWSRHHPSPEDFEAAYAWWEAMQKTVSGVAV